MSQAVVTQHADQSRFEIHLGETLAGYLDYRLEGDTWVLPHTRIFDEFGGQGLGGELVTESLSRIREQGGKVLPVCPFIPRVIREHPEFVDLVPESDRSRYGL